jgi:hypothetical protein
MNWTYVPSFAAGQPLPETLRRVILHLTHATRHGWRHTLFMK